MIAVAGGIIINPEKKIALVAKTDAREGHDLWWSYPKGHVDAGESLIDAAMREIEEETGIGTLRLIRLLGTYQRYTYTSAEKTAGNEKKQISVFLFCTPETELTPQDPEHPEAKWCTFSEACTLISHPKDQSFLRSHDGVQGECVNIAF